ncbi:Unconventional myosin-XV [Balamuthia mandrillaris]
MSEEATAAAEAAPASSAEGIENMIHLQTMTEETILQNLKVRYNDKKIYTYTGSILVSVNPYEELPIYTTEVARSYINQPMGEMPPHVFAIADEAYRCMLRDGSNQSVIISGESGAGKTEATKLMLQFLAFKTRSEQVGKKQTENLVEQLLLESSPILEAFGNAKTVRNDNSSRFGKYINIQFDQRGAIVGAKIENYLLEKSRLAYQAPDERNYHIFYALCRGLSEEDREQWHIGPPESFHYLNQSGCTTIKGVDDAKDLKDIKNAMQLLGMGDQQETVFQTVAAILHLGNTRFVPRKEGDGCAVENMEELQIAAKLLGVPVERLAKVLVTRFNKIRGEVFEVPLSPAEAGDVRDAIAKALYGRQFDWLVECINKSTQRTHKQGDKITFIGILDIFGFENFKVNSFEQLCINYTNEKLQQLFNQHIFKQEQEEYTKEQIDWTNIAFKDNQGCIDLIESKLGILSLLQEECRFPKASDESLLLKLHDNLQKSDFYEKPKRRGPHFIVKHYAGDVSYDVTGFLEKNKDTVMDSVAILLANSNNPHISGFFQADAAMATTSGGGGGGGGGGGASRRGPTSSAKDTVGLQFKNQLSSLVATLSSTKPYYVRCMKPNTLKQANLFDDDLVLTQLRYCGMLETIRIRKLGFPIRRDFETFNDRYALLEPASRQVEDPKEAALMILNRASSNLPVGTYTVGLTKVFLRDEPLAILEDMRNAFFLKSAICLQTNWRAFLLRRRYQQIKASSGLLQKFYRRFAQRTSFLNTREATTAIQSAMRMRQQRTKYTAVRAGTIALQAAIRTHNAVQLKIRLVEEEKERQRRLEEIKRLKDKEERERREREEQERQERERQRREEEERAKQERERKRLEEEERARREEEERQRKKEEEERMMQLNLNLQEQKQVQSLQDMLTPRHSTSARFYSPRDAVPPSPPTREEVELEQDMMAALPPPPAEWGDLPPPPFEMGMPPVPPEAGDGDLPDFAPGEMPELPSAMEAPEGDGEEAEEQPSDAANYDFDFYATEEDDAADYKWQSEEGLYGHYFEAYAKQRYREHKKLSLQQLMCWSKDPLKASLLELQSEEDNKVAIEVSKKIHAYLRSKKSVDDNFATIAFLLRVGLRDSSASIPPTFDPAHPLPPSSDVPLTPSAEEHKDPNTTAIQDEIWCQLCKQVMVPPTSQMAWKSKIKGPDANSLKRGWDLMKMAACTFPPSDELAPYVFSLCKSAQETAQQAMQAPETASESIHSIISQSAAFVDTSLKRMGRNGPRKYVPSVMELKAIEKMEPILCRVFFMDGAVKAFFIDSSTTAAELKQEVVSKLGLAYTFGFFLVKVYGNIERAMNNSSKVGDEIAEFETLRDVMKMQGVEVRMRIAFKKRIFLPTPNDSLDLFGAATRNLLFHQVVEEIRSATLPTSREKVLELCGLKCQYDYGDNTRLLIPAFVELHVPMYLRTEATDTERWMEDLLQEHTRHAGISAEEAKLQYLQRVQELPLYGATMFAMKLVTNTVKLIRDQGYLAISGKGLSFVTRDHNGQVVMTPTIPFSDVLSWSHEGTNTTIHAIVEGERSVIELACHQSSEIDLLMKEYVEQLTASSQYAKALVDYHVPDTKHLLSFNKGDIIFVKSKKGQRGWYYGECKGKAGHFPIDMVQMLVGVPVDIPEATPSAQSTLRSATSKRHSFHPNTHRLSQEIGGPSLRDRASTDTCPSSSSSPAEAETEGSSPTAGSPLDESNSDAGNQGHLPRITSMPIGGNLSKKIHYRRTMRKSAMWKKKVAIEMEEITSFSKEPIHDSLLPLAARDNKAALKMFKRIMMYMGDLPCKIEQEIMLPQRILEQGINNRELRDETYCQLMKQVHKNPRPTSEERGWILIALACSTFIPSDSVLAELMKLLEDKQQNRLANPTVAFIASAATERLQNAMLIGERSLGPSLIEVNALKRRQRVVCRISMPDGAYRALHIDPWTTVREVLPELISKQVHFQDETDPKDFALFASASAVSSDHSKSFIKYPIPEQAQICEALTRWETLEQAKGKKLKKLVPEFALQLRKQIIRKEDDERVLKDNNLCEFLFAQMVEDFLSGQLPIPDEKLVLEMGAILVNLLFRRGKNSSAPLLPEMLDQFLPMNLLAQADRSQLLQGLIVECALKNELGGLEAKRWFLEQAHASPLYGLVIYPVREDHNDLWLALGPEKLMLVEPFTGEVLKEWTFKDIANWGSTRTDFHIVAGNLFKPEKRCFSCPYAPYITVLFGHYLAAWKELNE